MKIHKKFIQKVFDMNLLIVKLSNGKKRFKEKKMICVPYIEEKHSIYRGWIPTNIGISPRVRFILDYDYPYPILYFLELALSYSQALYFP